MTEEITTVDQLEAAVGLPTGLAVTEERCCLTDIDRAWLAATPFRVLTTSDAEGRCGASPKGDPPGQLERAPRTLADLDDHYRPGVYARSLY